MTASASLVNGSIHSFAPAVALELENGLRINVVTAGMVEDAIERFETCFPGHNPDPMWKVANTYVRSAEEKGTGENVRVYDD